MRGAEVNDLTDLRNLLSELKKADESVANFTKNVTIFREWANSWCENIPSDAKYFDGIEILVPPPQNFVAPSREMNLSDNSHTSESLFQVSQSSENQWQDQINESAQSPSPIVLTPLDLTATPPPPPRKYRLLELANWAYETTIMCEVCKQEDSEQMLECENCSSFYHLGCVGLNVTPDHAWTCYRCLDDRRNE